MNWHCHGGTAITRALGEGHASSDHLEQRRLATGTAPHPVQLDRTRWPPCSTRGDLDQHELASEAVPDLSNRPQAVPTRATRRSCPSFALREVTPRHFPIAERTSRHFLSETDSVSNRLITIGHGSIERELPGFPERRIARSRVPILPRGAATDSAQREVTPCHSCFSRTDTVSVFAFVELTRSPSRSTIRHKRQPPVPRRAAAKDRGSAERLELARLSRHLAANRPR